MAFHPSGFDVLAVMCEDVSVDHVPELQREVDRAEGSLARCHSCSSLHTVSDLTKIGRVIQSTVPQRKAL